MKKLLFLGLLATLLACGDLDGYQDDTIKLSANKHTFEAAGGNFTVTSKGVAWSYKVYCNGGRYESEKDPREFWYEKPLPDTIKGPWFWVAWQEEKMFIIHADANDSADKRSFTIELPAGDYFGHIDITQKGRTNQPKP